MEPGITHDSGNCRAVADVLARIGDKWTVYIVNLLSNGPMRFNEIRRAVSRTLIAPLKQVGSWAIANRDYVEAARAKFDLDNAGSKTAEALGRRRTNALPKNPEFTSTSAPPLAE